MGHELAFEIRLDSDYHVGSGHGGTGVDSSLMRDSDGVPAIRGISGLLRDAAWRLLQQPPLHWARKCSSSTPRVLERQSAGKGDRLNRPPYCESDDACPICRIFGTPGRPKPWAFRTARPVDEGLPSGGDRPRCPWDGHRVTRARVSPRTRRAEARKLFSQEQGDGRLVFRFIAHTAREGKAAAEEAAFIVAAARVARGLGRGRRRGQGACRIHLVDPTAEEEWLRRFREHWLDRRPAAATAPVPTTPAVVTNADRGSELRLRVIARADEPLVLASRAEAGNEFETRPWISGTVLLGALAARVASRHDLHEPGAREAFVRLFLRGRLRFSPLLPVVLDGQRLVPAIPVPLDLLTCKAFPGFSEPGAHPVAGYAGEAQLPRNCPECGAPLRSLSGLVLVHPNPVRFDPRRRHEMHIAIEHETGRVGEGDLFGYVGLDAGQYFLGEIHCRDVADWTSLSAMAALPERGESLILQIGKATGRGHGQVALAFDEIRAGERDPWRGLPLGERVPGARSSELVMTLLTDAIVPDPWLRARVGFEEQWLGQLLGVKLTIVRAFCRSRAVDGFFGHLGLPRFRDVALVAGSAVGLRLAWVPDGFHETLRRVERDGIGLRREEGYGQVVFNHPIYSVPSLPSENRIRIPEALVRQGATESVPALIAGFRRLWERELEADGLQECEKDEFNAVARLLRHQSSAPFDVLRSRLEDFGKPKNVAGLAPLGGPRGEKGIVARTKAGRARLVELLGTLEVRVAESEGPPAECQRVGVEILAERVAAAAEAARAERERPALGGEQEARR
jgi:CRISPR-associated protein Csx10